MRDDGHESAAPADPTDPADTSEGAAIVADDEKRGDYEALIQIYTGTPPE